MEEFELLDDVGEGGGENGEGALGEVWCCWGAGDGGCCIEGEVGEQERDEFWVAC